MPQMLRHNEFCYYRNGFIFVLGMPLFRYEIFKQSLKLTTWNQKTLWFNMGNFDNLESLILDALMNLEDEFALSTYFIVSKKEPGLLFFKICYLSDNYAVVENEFGENIKVHRGSKIFAWLEYMLLPPNEDFIVSLDNQIIAKFERHGNEWFKSEIGCDRDMPFSGNVKKEILRLRLQNPRILVTSKTLD